MIRLEKINANNVWKILKLEVEDFQKDFVATNTESIVEAYTTTIANGVAIPFGIYNDDEPVGFAMLAYGVDDSYEEYPSIAKDNYCIWRLMIDKKYQGKGYGRKAIELLIDYVKTFPFGKADYLYLSYEPENTLAKKLYASFGFKETGEMDGDEVIAALKL